jgi:hypothetical protein
MLAAQVETNLQCKTRTLLIPCGSPTASLEQSVGLNAESRLRAVTQQCDSAIIEVSLRRQDPRIFSRCK